MKKKAEALSSIIYTHTLKCVTLTFFYFTDVHSATKATAKCVMRIFVAPPAF